MPYQITITESAPHTVLRLHRQVRSDRAGEDISAGMRELYERARGARLLPTGPPATTYLGRFGPGQVTDVEFTVPIGQSAADTGSNGVEMVLHPAGLVARTQHHGDYHGIGAAYEALERWIGAAHYRAAGPPSEIYLVGPDQTADPRDLVTEIRMPVTKVFARTMRLPLPFGTVVEVIRQALRDQGFGVLTEIDLRATLRESLGIEIEDYLILGACNPPLALRALAIDPQIGLLLPCNVVVRTEGAHTLVEALDPDVLVRASEQPALQPIADEAREKLAAALDALRAKTADSA